MIIKVFNRIRLVFIERKVRWALKEAKSFVGDNAVEHSRIRKVSKILTTYGDFRRMIYDRYGVILSSPSRHIDNSHQMYIASKNFGVIEMILKRIESGLLPSLNPYSLFKYNLRYAEYFYSYEIAKSMVEKMHDGKYSY